MAENKSSCIVLGEASESDEDDFKSPDNKLKNIERVLPSSIVAGEASESEDEIEGDYNITAAAFKSKAEEVHYNSLLHKKLRESNAKLRADMKDLVINSFKFAADQVNDINQRLLTNQIEIQDTIKHLRRSSVSSEKLVNALASALSQNYLPCIKIN